MLGTLCTLITALTCKESDFLEVLLHVLLIMSLYVSLYYMSSSYFPGVSGVTVVTQKPPVVTVRKGDTATMDCNLGTVDNSARWYKQVAGGVPQYVLQWYYYNWTSIKYGSGFSSPKFTSNHQSISDYHLIINNVEEEDSAVYHYGDLSTPAVTLFPPSTEDLKSSRATLVCLASNLSQRSKGLQMSAGCLTQPDKTFKISSYLTIQTAEWDKDVVFTCKVSLGSTFSEKEIRKTICNGDLSTPAVTLFPPSTEDLKSSRATLVCLASNLSQRSKGLQMSAGCLTQPDKTFKISSYLTIQTAEWDKDVVFTCKVSLGSTFSEKEIRKTICSVSGVTVVTQKPPVVTVRKGDTATMDCNLGTVENSGARWYKQVPGGVPQFVLYFYHTNSAPTYGSGFSSPKFTSNHQSKSDYRLIINTVEESDSAVYYCQTYDSSVKDVELKSSKVTLVCLASQMAMGYADVSWTAGGNPVTSGIATSGPVPQADKTFQLSSCLTVDTSEWNQDKVFSCKVTAGSKFAEKGIKKSECSTE
ncbi:unnamed protein product [Coregonus sp. 'balchen']|nr:unnamed protein product [Coregonus sp. 'balchen']